MYNNSANAYHIYRLMWGTQTWVDTGVQLDDWRDPLDPKNTKADTVWDAANNKLYVVSHDFTERPSPIKNEINYARLYRYTYDAINQTYTLDSDFQGPDYVTVNQDKTQTLAIDKDSTGRLWTTYVSRSPSGTDYQVYVNASNGGALTDDDDWGTPFTLPAPVPAAASTVLVDDISTLVSLNDHIAIVWSNQSEAMSDTINLALHRDINFPSSGWKYYSATLPPGIHMDNHLSSKSLAVSPNGQLFVGLKLNAANPTDPEIGMLAFDTNKTFSFHEYSRRENNDTRPMLVMDESANKVYMFVTGKPNGSHICYKTLDIKPPGQLAKMGDFLPLQDGLNINNCGITFIKDKEDEYKNINNATSMKGNVSALTGIVVLAADDKNGQYYAHNTMGNPPPVVDLTAPARNAMDAPADRSPISAIFSKEMDEASIEEPGNFVVKDPGDVPIAGTVSYDSVLKKGTFVPDQPLATETTYTVELTSDIKDSGTPGKSLNEGIVGGTIRETWQFTTLGADATPTVRFSTTEYAVNEGDGSATIAVSLYPTSTNQVTINFNTSDGTATAPDDYTAVPNQQIVFAPGDDIETISVTIIDDNLNELNETINLHLANAAPPGVLIANSPATLRIVDNDPEPDAMFTSNAYTVHESSGKAILDVKLSAVSGRSVAVNYATSAGSATPGVDYEETAGTVTFAKGQMVQSIEITILDDNSPDSGESFNVNLSNPDGATLNTPPIEAKVTITEAITDQVLVYLPLILGD